MYSVFQGARVSTSTVQCDLLPIFLRVDVSFGCILACGPERVRGVKVRMEIIVRKRERKRKREWKEREREKAWMRFSNVSLDWLDWKELARDGLSGNIIGW